MKVLVSVILLSIFFSACSSPGEQGDNHLVISGNTMGTTYTIKIVKNNFLLLGDTTKKVKVLEEGITSLLHSINMKMSTYIPDSEISMFNNFKKNSWLEISPETTFVLSNSIKISEMTGGAFDITIGPLTNLWGFGPDRKPIKIPAQELSLEEDVSSAPMPEKEDEDFREYKSDSKYIETKYEREGRKYQTDAESKKNFE